MEQRDITLGGCTLRADLVGPIALGQRCCTRAAQRNDLAGVVGVFCAQYLVCMNWHQNLP